MIGDLVRQIEVVGVVDVLLIVVPQLGPVEVVAAAAHAKEPVEAATHLRRQRGVSGHVAHMPLAGDVGPVAARLQHFGHGDAAFVEIALVTRGVRDEVRHVANPGLVRVDAGQQCGPRGTAAGEAVHLGEAHA